MHAASIREFLWIRPLISYSAMGIFSYSFYDLRCFCDHFFFHYSGLPIILSEEKACWACYHQLYYRFKIERCKSKGTQPNYFDYVCYLYTLF